VKFYPEVDSYKLYYAQCLHKAGLYPEATKACLRVDSEQYAQRLLQLQAAIKYEGGLSAGAGMRCRCRTALQVPRCGVAVHTRLRSRCW
jgi:tetratricopeptide repeat protein 30